MLTTRLYEPQFDPRKPGRRADYDTAASTDSDFAKGRAYPSEQHTRAGPGRTETPYRTTQKGREKAYSKTGLPSSLASFPDSTIAR